MGIDKDIYDIKAYRGQRLRNGYHPIDKLSDEAPKGTRKKLRNAVRYERACELEGKLSREEFKKRFGDFIERGLIS